MPDKPAWFSGYEHKRRALHLQPKTAPFPNHLLPQERPISWVYEPSKPSLYTTFLRPCQLICGNGKGTRPQPSQPESSPFCPRHWVCLLWKADGRGRNDRDAIRLVPRHANYRFSVLDSMRRRQGAEAD